MQKPVNVILGSQSPRRLEILQDAGFIVKVIEPKVEEVFPPQMSAELVPEFLAQLKLEAVYSAININDTLLICADTIVLFENKIIGKPVDTAQSYALLSALNGKSHQVITGVCMRYQHKQITFSETAKVFFKNLNKETIEQYINTCQTLDKAGAYNIQEYKGIDRIEGEFYNVMGLPINRVLQEIEKW